MREKPTLLDTPEETQPFFLEIFSGSGRLSAAVRDRGIKCIEIDITKQGNFMDVLDKKVFAKLKAYIDNPNCRGVWFGFPCGTFSSARRHDGGPPPLRGFNSKDINGLPGLKGKDLARVQSANRLLNRMMELMKDCERRFLPFYLENPLRSKLWLHPLVRKWVQHKDTNTVVFD